MTLPARKSSAPPALPVARRPMTPIDIVDFEESARAVSGMSFEELAMFGGSDLLSDAMAAKVRAARVMAASCERVIKRPARPPPPEPKEVLAAEKVEVQERKIAGYRKQPNTPRSVIDSEGNRWPSLRECVGDIGGHITNLKAAINASREYHGRKVWLERRAPRWALELAKLKSKEGKP